MFAAYFWHTEGLSASYPGSGAEKGQNHEAPMADMSPENFEKCLWFRKDHMHVIVPEGVSTCRSKNDKGIWVEKVWDFVIACNSVKGKISNQEAVTFVAEKGQERGRNGESKESRRCYLDPVEEGYRKKHRRKQVGKQERKKRDAEKSQKRNH